MGSIFSIFPYRSMQLRNIPHFATDEQVIVEGRSHSVQKNNAVPNILLLRKYVIILINVFFSACYTAYATEPPLLSGCGGWSAEDIPITYVIDNTFTSEEEDAIERAFNTWGSITGSSLKFQRKSYTNEKLNSDQKNNPADIFHLITKSDLEDLPEWHQGLFSDEDGGTAAFPLFTPGTENGRIFGGGIIFLPHPNNSALQFWSTSDWPLLPLRKDIEKVALHEIGHLIGLAHPHEPPGDSESEETIMGAIDYNQLGIAPKRTLFEGDKAAVRKLYPPLTIPTNAYLDTVQKIYIGYYQRPADPVGLIYWAGILASNGGNLNGIIEAFANSAEAQTFYGTINSSNISNIVNGIYNALFGRDAEPGGLAYYVEGFNAGRFTAATIMLNVLYGAQNEDLLSVNNKVTATNLFTRTIDPDLDGSNFQATYAGDGDAIAGRNFLSLYASSVRVPTQAETTAYIQANIADPGDPINIPTITFAYVMGGGVSAYAINATTGALAEINGSPFAAGENPHSGTVDPTGKFLYVANFGWTGVAGGSISAFTINATTGALAKINGSPFPTGSNPVSVTVEPTGKFVYVANNWAVSAYAINATTGALAEINGSPFAAGTCPHFVTVDRTGKFAYVANFLSANSNVSAFTINATTGALAKINGSPFPTGSDPVSVTVDPTGKFVYVANLGSDNISAYTINATSGALTEISGSPFDAGRLSATIAVDPTGKFAYVANLGSGNISAFTINATTGTLAKINGSPFVTNGSPWQIMTIKK